MNPLRRIGVESSELRFFSWAGLCLMLVGAGSAALQNAAETLFLKRIGVESLPLVFLGSSLVLAFATMIASQLLEAVDRPNWLPRVLAALGLSLVPVWAAVFLEVPGVLAALLVLVKLLDGIALLVYWIALGDLITGRQAKRLFAPLAAGMTLGRLIGSFGTEPAARLAGIEGLVLVSGVLYVLAALCAVPLRRTGNRESAPAPPGVTSIPTGVPGESRPTPRPPGLKSIWKESRLFRFLVAWSFCAGALGPMLYFQFSYAVDVATAGPNGEAQMLALYARFRGLLNTAVLVLQLVVSAKLYRRFGLPMSAAVWPVTYLAGFVWMGVSLQLPVALGTIAATRLEGDAVAKPALKILHNLLPDRFRSRATGFTEGPVKGIGGAFGNALVIGAIGLSGPAVVSLPAMPLAAIWVLAAVSLWRLYPRLLLQASARHGLSSSEEDLERLLDPSTIRALAKSLSDPDPDVCRAAAELIAEADPTNSARALSDAVAEASPEARPLLIETLARSLESSAPGEVFDQRASAAILGLLDQRAQLPPEERAELVQIYARLSSGEERDGIDPVLDDALGDPEAAVRLAAIAELSRRGTPPPGVRDLDSAVAGAFASDEVLLRRTALAELRADLLTGEPGSLWRGRLALLVSGLERRVDRAPVAASLVEVVRHRPEAREECQEPLLRRLSDADPRVRGAVLEFIGEAGLLEHCGELIDRLGSREEVEAQAAQEGLVALGPAVSEPLMRSFRSDDIRYRDRVIGALCRLGPDPILLAELYEQELQAARQRAVLLLALDADDGETHPLLLKALEERIDEGLGAALVLIAAMDGADRVADLEGQMRGAGDAHRRSILVEALESLLAPEERRHLVPIFEAETGQQRGRVAAAQLGVEVPDADEARERLADESDPLLRRLAAEPPPPRLEASELIADTPAVPMEPTQIAAHLQRAPGFNRLSTRQLVRVAEAFRETRRESGDLFFDEGDEATSLLVIVSGEVQLSIQDREVGRLASGDLVGGASTLDGGRRMERARAVGEVVALELGRESLLELMSEAPAFGIGLGQQLVAHIRRLQIEVLRAGGSASDAEIHPAEGAGI